MSTRRQPSRPTTSRDRGTPTPSSSQAEDEVSEVEDELTPRTTTRTTRAHGRAPSTSTRQRITPAGPSTVRRAQTDGNANRSLGVSGKGKGRADALILDGGGGRARSSTAATPRSARPRQPLPPPSISRNTRSQSAQSNQSSEQSQSEQDDADDDEPGSSSPPPVELAPSPLPDRSERALRDAASALLDFYYDSRRGRIDRSREQRLWRVLISHKELLLPPVAPATSSPLYINTDELPSTTTPYLKSAIALSNMAAFLHSTLLDAASAPTELTIASFEDAWTEVLTVLAAKDQGMSVHDGVLTLLLDMGTQLYIQKLSTGVIRVREKDVLLGEIFSSTLLSRRGYLPAGGRDAIKTQLQARWKSLTRERIKKLKATPTPELPAMFPSSDFELELINFVQARRPKRRAEDDEAAEEPDQEVEEVQEAEPPRKRARKSEPAPQDRPRTSIFPAPRSARQPTAADETALLRRSLPATSAFPSVPRPRPRTSALPPISPPPPPPAQAEPPRPYAIPPPPPRPRTSNGPRYSVVRIRPEELSGSSADEEEEEEEEEEELVNVGGMESSEAEEEASVEDEVSADEEEEEEDEEVAEEEAPVVEDGGVSASEVAESSVAETSDESDDGEATPTRPVAPPVDVEEEIEMVDDDESSSEEDDEEKAPQEPAVIVEETVEIVEESLEIETDDVLPKLKQVEGQMIEMALATELDDDQPLEEPNRSRDEVDEIEDMMLPAVLDLDDSGWEAVLALVSREGSVRASAAPVEDAPLISLQDKGKGRADPLPAFPDQNIAYYPDFDDQQPLDDDHQTFERVESPPPPRPIRPIPSQSRPSAPRQPRSFLKPPQMFNSDPSSDEEDDSRSHFARKPNGVRPSSIVHLPPGVDRFVTDFRREREKSLLRVKDIPALRRQSEEPWRAASRARSQSQRIVSNNSQRSRRMPSSSAIAEDRAASVLNDRTEGGPWGPEETKFFIKAAKALPLQESEPWAELLALHGPHGRESQIFCRRTNVNLKDKMRGILMQYPAHGGDLIPAKLLRYLPRKDPRYNEWEKAQGVIDPAFIPKRSGGQSRIRAKQAAKRTAVESSEDENEMMEEAEDEDDDEEAGMVAVGEVVAVGEESSEGESDIAP